MAYALSTLLTDYDKLLLLFFFWFPRAFVRTHSGRASVQSLSFPRRWRVANAFPRRRVGTRKMRVKLAHNARILTLYQQA